MNEKRQVIERIRIHIEGKLKKDERALRELMGKDDGYYLGKVNAENEILGYLNALKGIIDYE